MQEEITADQLPTTPLVTLKKTVDGKRHPITQVEIGNTVFTVLGHHDRLPQAAIKGVELLGEINSCSLTPPQAWARAVSLDNEAILAAQQKGKPEPWMGAREVLRNAGHEPKLTETK